ncbi:MAG: hypothetical protein J5985_06920 [Kiritimatiellae bacterium]|nr:hypothetical protein [Kiritimatiellia bacterium]
MNFARILGFLFLAGCAGAVTPQEESFLKVWSVHVRTGTDHRAFLAACQPVMQKTSTLGEWLPAVKTLAAWHLYAMGDAADAERVFESAMLKGKAKTATARFADIQAKRWLTRFDAVRVGKALRSYYVAHVEYPVTLAPVLTAAKGAPLPRTDRFGDAWNYRLAEFSKIKGLTNQRFVLYSPALGREGTSLKTFSQHAYGAGLEAAVIGVKPGMPLLVDFEAVRDGKRERGISGEGGKAVNGIRLVKLASDASFALMIDSAGDFWILAKRARR